MNEISSHVALLKEAPNKRRLFFIGLLQSSADSMIFQF